MRPRTEEGRDCHRLRGIFALEPEQRGRASGSEIRKGSKDMGQGREEGRDKQGKGKGDKRTVIVKAVTAVMVSRSEGQTEDCESTPF